MPKAQVSALLTAVIAASVSLADAVTYAEPSNNLIDTVREVRTALRACWVPPIIANMAISGFIRLG
jgi:hypothetical protein